MSYFLLDQIVGVEIAKVFCLQRYRDKNKIEIRIKIKISFRNPTKPSDNCKRKSQNNVFKVLKGFICF